MNQATNKFERLQPDTDQGEDPGPEDPYVLGLGRALAYRQSVLLRPNGEPVPETWVQFQVGEFVEIKGYTFKVAYIGESAILLEPVRLEIGR